MPVILLAPAALQKRTSLVHYPGKFAPRYGNSKPHQSRPIVGMESKRNLARANNDMVRLGSVPEGERLLL